MISGPAATAPNFAAAQAFQLARIGRLTMSDPSGSAGAIQHPPLRGGAAPQTGVWWHPTAWFGDADCGARVRYVRLWLSDEQTESCAVRCPSLCHGRQCTGQRTTQSVGGS